MNKPFALLLVAFVLAAGGCQAVPGEGPTLIGASRTGTNDYPFDVIDLTPRNVSAYRPEAAPATSVSSVQQASATHFAVGPEDVLTVHIVERYVGGIFATLHQPGTLVVTRHVTADGTIDVPFVGAVAVAGKDLRQIEADILARLAGKANEPQVMVELEADRTNVVTVSGAVAKPGPLSLTDGTQSLIEAINRAGGPLYPTGQDGSPGVSSGQPTGPIPNPAMSGAAGYSLSTGGAVRGTLTASAKTLGDASQMKVVVRRQGRVVLDKPFSNILMGGDMPLRKGDEIVVSPNTQVLTILGAVQKAGNLPIVKPNMTLADALGEASGLFDPRAEKTGVLVFRGADSERNQTNRGQIFRLDLMQPVSVFVAQQFGVYPRDVIYVTNAPLYEYDKVLKPIYRTLATVSVARNGQ